MTNQILLNKNRNEKIETPYEGDFWNRKQLAEKLTGYVERLKIGATIAIDAEWGGGKSWFVRNWKADLEQNDFNVIYLDAFERDYLEDPFLTIAMEIASEIEKGKIPVTKLKETMGNACRAILPSLPLLMCSLITYLIGAGYLGEQIAEILKDAKDSAGELGEKAGELLNEKLKEHLQAQVENYENEKESLAYFKTELIKVAAELDKPLVFIIDELDRCKPEFSIRLIERIKHFFDIPNIVFVLAINKKQLEESINSFYGFQTANNYLEKFLDFNIKLFSLTSCSDSYLSIINEYNDKLSLNLDHYFIKIVNLYFIIYRPNTRQVINLLQKLAFLENGNGNIYKLNYLIIFILTKDLGLWNDLSNEENQVLKIFKEKATIYIQEMGFAIPTDENGIYQSIQSLLNHDREFGRQNIGHLLEALLSTNTPNFNRRDIITLKKKFMPIYEDSELSLDEAWNRYISCGFLL